MNKQDTDQSITIVVEFNTKPDRVDDAKRIVKDLVPHVLAEQGNLSVLMYEDPEDPTHFLFIETFESREAEKAHTQTPHILQFYQDITPVLDGESSTNYWRSFGRHLGAGARI